MQKPNIEHPLLAVLDTALDAVIVIDSAGSIVNWNEVASEAFGWTRAEAVGCLLSDLIIPHRFREAHRRGLEAFLRTGVGPVLRKRIEVTALRKTGEEFPVELSITPYVDDGLLVFLGFLRDITERKRTAARWNAKLSRPSFCTRQYRLPQKQSHLSLHFEPALQQFKVSPGGPLGTSICRPMVILSSSFHLIFGIQPTTVGTGLESSNGEDAICAWRRSARLRHADGRTDVDC